MAIDWDTYHTSEIQSEYLYRFMSIEKRAQKIKVQHSELVPWYQLTSIAQKLTSI